VPRAFLGADTAYENDLAARSEDAHEFVERRLGVGAGRYHVVRGDHVERRIGKFEMLGVHHLEPLDMVERQFRHPLLRLAQHGLGNVDADDAILG